MNLFLLELRRLFARRLVRLTLVGAFVSVLLVDGLIGARSSKDIAGAQATALRVEQQQYQDCLAAVGQADGPTRNDCDRERPAAQAKACLAQASENRSGPADCARIKDMYLNDPRFHFADHTTDLLTGTTLILLAIAVVVGASALGGEWQSGTFAALLTWEPRRQRVLAAKLVAPVVAMAALAAVVLPLITAGAWLAADLRGTTAGTTGHVWASAAAQYGRCVGLVALASLSAAGLAALTRHTVAAVGIVGGYLIAGEMVGGIVSGWWRQHGLFAHLVALIRGTWSFSTPVRTATGEQFKVQTLHAASGAVLVSIVAVVIAGAAALMLARRDVA
jgi:ABC-2 type transport system permease protein